jgi:hypothetical protein
MSNDERTEVEKLDSKFYYLRTLNPAVVTQTVANDVVILCDEYARMKEQIRKLEVELSGSYAANQTLSEQLEYARGELHAMKLDGIKWNPAIGVPTGGSDHGC